MEELNRNKYDSDQHCINSGLVGTVLKKKLRDVLQEREDTSLNYLKLFSNYIEQNSRAIISTIFRPCKNDSPSL